MLPAPIIAFADRNVAEWWRQYRHDFRRLQYGLQLNCEYLRAETTACICHELWFRPAAGYWVFHSAVQQKERAGWIVDLVQYVSRSKRIAFNTLDDELAFMNLGTSWQLQKIQITQADFLPEENS